MAEKNPPGPDVTLRALTAADVAFAHELNTLVNWNQLERDWRGYLEYEPDGCFVAEAGGRSAGTATAIRYGERFGWIGMVLVHPESRRFGIGTKLLRHTIDYLQQRGTRCVKLDATPMGRKVYVPLGFIDEYEVSRYEGTAWPDIARPVVARGTDQPTPEAVDGNTGIGRPEEGIFPLTDAELPAVIAFDAPVFGAEREAVLRSMSRRNPALCHVARDDSGVRGYLIAREGRQAIQLGPWIARDAAVAETLLRALFHRAGGRRIFVDVPHPNAGGRALVEKYGFAIQRGFTRMYLGENRHPGQPEWVFGTSGAEKG